MLSIEQRIAADIAAQTAQVKAAVDLLDGGATVPFIARYRKEVTGGLDDTQLRLLEERLGYLRELEDRRAAILDSIAEQGKLDDALKAQILEADTKARLEDLYLPYKPKRRTKAQIAREAGLEPLALGLREDPSVAPEARAAAFVDADKGVPDIKAALDGARQILMFIRVRTGEVESGTIAPSRRSRSAAPRPRDARRVATSIPITPSTSRRRASVTRRCSSCSRCGTQQHPSCVSHPA